MRSVYFGAFPIFFVLLIASDFILMCKQVQAVCHLPYQAMNLRIGALSQGTAPTRNQSVPAGLDKAKILARERHTYTS